MEHVCITRHAMSDVGPIIRIRRESILLSLLLVCLSGNLAFPQLSRNDNPAMPQDVGRLSSCRAIVVVRHANRNGNLLSPVGDERARLLARVLTNSGITRVFVSQEARTGQTAKYLAEELHLPGALVTNAFYNLPGHDVMTRIRDQLTDEEAKNAVILIVCHHDQIQDFVGAFKHTCQEVKQNEYDKMFLIFPSADRHSSRFLQLRYGDRTGDDDEKDVGRALTSEQFRKLVSGLGLTLRSAP